MTSPQLVYLKWLSDDIVEIWLNRPSVRNAYSKALLELFINTLIDLKKNKKIKICIVRGCGTDFCAGGDIKSMLKQNDLFEGPRKKLSNTYKRYIQRLSLTLNTVNYLTIAVIQRGAIGAGVGLSLACDLIWCSENAYFRLPFVNLALAPADGSFWRLEKKLGYSHTLELFLSGLKIPAEKALKLGIINKIMNISSEKEMRDSLSQINSHLFSRLDWGKMILLLRQSPHISLSKHLKGMRQLQSKLQLQHQHAQALRSILK